ncbi:MAG: lipid-A-disaccharide synthase [Synergistaceae bacterium]|nr:lipid-A-disaccharide synthase [Synergistaceae bacterium]
MKNVFVSCGEVSGDIYAGDFVRELLRIDGNIHVWGMLGPNGENAGGSAKWSYEQLKLMGIVEVIPALPRIFRLKDEITRELMRVNPDAAVLIDSPDFHLVLARSLRKAGYTGKIISLIPPTVWAWRAGRVKNLKRDYDLCLPLFSFEHKFLIEHGVNSFWKAHPLVHELSGVKVPETFRERFGQDKVIALMPGSRRYDINYHLDILLGTAGMLRRKGYRPVFSSAPGLSAELAEILRERVISSGFDLWEGEGRELMLGSRAVAGVSGTVAVEAMLLGRYMVVIYNMKRLTYAILKRLVHVKHISIPNMLTGKQVYPELLCDAANPERIVSELERYLADETRRNEIDSSLHEARSSMGQEHAAKFWAECVMTAITEQQA